MIFVQPNMQAQEELAALFSRNLTLQQPVEPVAEEPTIVYISQHYNHSAHAVAKPQTAIEETEDLDLQAAPQRVEPFTPQQAPLSPRPASEPPQADHASVEAILRLHGVDCSALSASQLQLFKTAEDAQKQRLIELWRICPPTNSTDNPTLAWSFTTVDQEEVLARARWEVLQRREDEERAQKEREAAAAATVMSLDGTPLTPIQAGDGRWVMNMSHHYMEPYMASGYEAMARREYEESARQAYADALAREGHGQKEVYQPLGSAVGGPGYTSATDPVYAMQNSEWSHQAQLEKMENEYGRIMYCREDEEML
jgi:hypothetical protein